MAFPNLIITKNDRYSRKIDSPKMIALLKSKMIAVLRFNQQDDGDRTTRSTLVLIYGETHLILVEIGGDSPNLLRRLY
jgi:hypothetical protein